MASMKGSFTISLLFLAYGGFILCYSCLTVMIPAMIEDDSFSLEQDGVGGVLAWGNVGMFTGKVLLGPLSDKWGGKRTLLLAGVISTLMTSVQFAVHSTFTLTAAVFLTRFGCAAAWPCVSKLMSSSIPENQFGTASAIVSTASRAGSLASSGIIGLMLARGYEWRTLFLVVALAMAVITLVSWALINEDAPKQIQQIQLTVHTSLTSIVLEKRFFSLVISVMSLSCIMELEFFIPLFLRQHLHLPISETATTAMIFPIFCAIATITTGAIYDYLSQSLKMWSCGFSLLLACYSLQALSSLAALNDANLPGSSLSQNMGVSTLIAILCLSTSGWYAIPGPIFIVRVSKEHCATLTALIDAAGSIAYMICDIAGGSIVSSMGWPAFFSFLLAVSLTAFISTTAFMLLESHQQTDTKFNTEGIQLQNTPNPKSVQETERTDISGVHYRHKQSTT